MLNQYSRDECPLLEIEAIQLSNMFGATRAENEGLAEGSILAAGFTQQSVDELAELDIYRVASEKQDEAFLIAACEAFGGRPPVKEEFSDFLAMLRSSRDGYASVIAVLAKMNEDHVNAINNSRNDCIELTISNIDQWSDLKKFWRWK